ALRYVEQQEELLGHTAASLRVAPTELPGRIDTLLEERRRLEEEVSDLRRKLATGGASETMTREIDGTRLAARGLEDSHASDLKHMADALKKQLGSGIAAVISTTEGKASLVVGVTPDLTERYSAVDLVRVGAEALGGKGGGGRPDMAQAGGPNA